jgi:RNA polymerase sigma-70 factor (ECF subfamily)
VASVFREEAGHLTAWLVRGLGDFGIAEEIVQDALVAALEQWSVDGIPTCPRAWLRTVARRRAVDRLRREIRFRDKLAELEHSMASDPDPPDADTRLELIFTCCHPALSPENQIALTLRAVCGLTTQQIASAFVVTEATVAQRIVRAQRKILAAGIPYRVPREDELDARLDQVLSVLYLMFNEGYLSGGGPMAARRGVAEDAAWLADLLAGVFPTHAEVLGLVALMRLHLARAAARFDTAGQLVLLRDQDRRLWDQTQIAGAIAILERAGALGRPGAYQLQAAIAACHSEARAWEATDWPQILVLYDLLVRVWPSPVAQLNRAIALSYVAGPERALAEVQALAPALNDYYLLYAVRAELVRSQGQTEQARVLELRALELTRNPAEQSLLRRRMGRPRDESAAEGRPGAAGPKELHTWRAHDGAARQVAGPDCPTELRSWPVPDDGAARRVATPECARALRSGQLPDGGAAQQVVGADCPKEMRSGALPDGAAARAAPGAGGRREPSAAPASDESTPRRVPGGDSRKVHVPRDSLAGGTGTGNQAPGADRQMAPGRDGVRVAHASRSAHVPGELEC